MQEDKIQKDGKFQDFYIFPDILQVDAYAYADRVPRV